MNRCEHFILFIVIALLLPTGASVTLARPAELRVNVREGCRQAVSGGYLKVYDEREAARLYVKTVDETLTEITKALEATRARYAKERAAADSEGYDLQRSVTADQTAAEIRTLEARQGDYQEMKDSAEKKHMRLIEIEKSLRKAIEDVFKFDRTEDKPDGGYPLKLTYKAACPKFRHLCPLPKRDAAKLVSIKLDGATPEECQRYASLSQIDNAAPNP
jgi:hypothetical protein